MTDNIGVTGENFIGPIETMTLIAEAAHPAVESKEHKCDFICAEIATS